MNVLVLALTFWIWLLGKFWVMLAMLLTKKIRAVSEVPAGLCVISIIIIQSCQWEARRNIY